MSRNIGCPQHEHAFSRRGFLAGSTTALGVAGGLQSALQAETVSAVQQQRKQVLQIFLQGGVSQLESWDPKPGTVYGGPFRAIPTSVPGVHISELLPLTARQMHRLSLVRSINIKINDHGQGRLFMERGRRAGEFPFIGSVAAKYLSPENNPLPGYVHFSTRGIAGDTAAFLGAGHQQLILDGEKVPPNLDRHSSLSETSATRRNELRMRLNDRFAVGRQKANVDTYSSSFAQAARLMERRHLFEGEISAADTERYGKHPFARKCVRARTLLEAGVTCVKVTHHGYDTHAENFNFHIEQLGEFDGPFSTLLDDLAERGLLESTLVIVHSEFGRTPKINVRYGRDHWGTAWSLAIGGCGIVPGAVIGKTNDKGTAVADREVDAGHLFHTYFQALGLDTSGDHQLDGRSVPIGDPAAAPIKELLA